MCLTMRETIAQPFISVVIPAYNEEKYLPACLSSLRNQTYTGDNFNIIIVDNNSSDNTVEIARKYNLEVIIEKKQGHVFSLNTGMMKAAGKIIAVTDADTVVAANWLETIAKVFEDEGIVAVTGPSTLDTKSEIFSSCLRIMYRLFLQFNFFCGKPHLAAPNFAVRKEAFLKIKGLDTRYEIGSDVEIGLRLRKLGKIVFIKELAVTTSPRRWQGINFIKTCYKYTTAYIKVVWLMKPPKGSLLPVR